MSFTPISNELLDMNMSDGAFRLYCLIQSYCYGDKQHCFPSQKTLSERLRKSVRTIQRYINELVSLGLIAVKRRGSNSNLYEVQLKKLPRLFPRLLLEPLIKSKKNVRVIKRILKITLITFLKEAMI